MQEKKICRFCLSSKVVSTNPLISPCNCKGSLEFVHLKCLNRWRRIDIQRNGQTCSLCLAHYTFLQPLQLEIIPPKRGIFLYCLNYPGLILLIYNYIYAIALSSRGPYDSYYFFLEDIYMKSQYLFHFTYAVFFLSEWSVHNRELYWRQLRTIWTPLLLAFHYYLFVLLDKNMFILGPLVSFYMGLYWKGHIRVLENINVHLNNLENE